LGEKFGYTPTLKANRSVPQIQIATAEWRGSACRPR